GNKNPLFNIGNAKVLNKPEAVKIASNKLLTLQKLLSNNVNCVDHTTSFDTAKQWISNGHIVICRTLLCSNSGKGIIVARTTEELVAAPLYTKYVKKLIE